MSVSTFAYTRMRSGADALKPDLRVRAALKRCGLTLPRGDVALLVVGEHLAAELGVSLLVLDQLLWW